MRVFLFVEMSRLRISNIKVRHRTGHCPNSASLKRNRPKSDFK